MVNSYNQSCDGVNNQSWRENSTKSCKLYRMFRGDRMASLREERRLSQSELARRIGVSATTIWKLENEPAQGSKHTHKLARELGTSASYLMDETSDQDAAGPEDWLSEDERALVDAYRELELQQRKALLVVATTMQPAVAGKGQTLHSPRQEFRGKD